MFKWILFLAGIFCWTTSVYAHAGVGDDVYEKLFKGLDLFESGDVAVLWTIIPLAFLYGVLHAFGPGHGKFVVISYFSSHNARYLRGIIAGVQIALIHALSSIVIVLVAQKLAQVMFVGDSSLRYMKLVSYAVIAMLGLFMLFRHLHKCSCACCCHGLVTLSGEKKMGWLLGFGVGLVPCPSILAFLFYTMSEQMLGTGIILVFCMSAGMALALCVLGIISIFASKKLLCEYPAAHQVPSKFSIFLRCAAAGMIIVIGVVMFILEL
ncbi:MAG: hypothetical protein LBE20_00895 [Deltaproteobacteria bacterium]|jgi:ABC-type nickel/cobalt efflux system permease component RcnA|nr:hypothetical protein [Deltaproteobacteria bacterium]